MTRAALRLSEDRHDGVPVLIISGELDPFGAASLLTWARGFADGPDRATVWDISGLRHPDGHHLLTAFPAAQRLVGPWPRRSIHLTGAAPAVVNSLGRLRVDRGRLRTLPPGNCPRMRPRSTPGMRPRSGLPTASGLRTVSVFSQACTAAGHDESGA